MTLSTLSTLNYPPFHVTPSAEPDACEACGEGWEIDGRHHHELYVTREGASTRTADSLAWVFLWDVAELLQLPDDPNNLSARYRVPAEIKDPDGWYDDPDDADAIQDEVSRAESALSDAGLYVEWDDGYVIGRVVVEIVADLVSELDLEKGSE